MRPAATAFAVIVLAGCDLPAPPPAVVAPARPEVAEAEPECGPRLERVQRLDLGADHRDVLLLPSGVAAAGGTGVLHLPEAGGEATWWETPGEATALARCGGALWVADGGGGLARIDPSAASPRAVTFPTGGRVVDVACAGGRVFAADHDGRVLVLAADAPRGAVPGAVEVDGWPRALAAWGDGVLVATGKGGLRAVAALPDGRLIDSPAPCAAANAYAVAASRGRIWVSEGPAVHRCGPGEERASARLPEWVEGLTATADGVLAAVGPAGVHAWDGQAAAATPWGPHPPFAHEVVVDGPGLWIAGGTSGLHRAEGDHVRTAARGGWIADLEPHLEGVEVLLDGGAAPGERVRLVPGPAGWMPRERGPAGGTPQAAASLGDALAVARLGQGVGRSGPRGTTLTALPGTQVHGVAGDGAGDGWAVTQEGTLVRLSGDGSSWGPVAESSLAPMRMPGTVAVLGATAGVGDLYGPLLGRVPLPAGAPVDVVPLPAPAGQSWDPHPFARVRAWGGRFWVPMPSFGLEAVPAVHGAAGRALPADAADTTGIRLVPGAWDAQPWGEGAVLARGRGGVSVLVPDPASGLTLECTADLPGDARRVHRDGDSLLVAASGTVFVLSTAVRGRPIDSEAPPTTR